jgi:hypothetical protein
MPRPRRHDTSGAKLTIKLLPSKVAPVNTDINVPVDSSQFATVGRISEFHIQLILAEPVGKIERLLMSYVLMTNGRITLTGEFSIEPTKECQSKTIYEIHSEEQRPPTYLLKGTLSIQITRDMIPYSTLIVYTFQPTFGINVIESYRFSVTGLFQSSLTLNATVIESEPTETIIENIRCKEELNIEPVRLSEKVQDRTCLQLSFTGEPGSIVGLNVVEYGSVLSGLSNDMTKERVLQYFTSNEHKAHPNKMTAERLKPHIPEMGRRTISEKDEEELIRREQQVFKK